MAQLQERLFSELEVQGDPQVLGKGDVFDEYPYADTQHRKFYERYMEGELGPEDAGWVNPSDFEPHFPDSLRMRPAPATAPRGWPGRAVRCRGAARATRLVQGDLRDGWHGVAHIPARRRFF